MISYSTNFMGPINLQWYRDRNIPFKNNTTPAIMYAGGRIDVYGLSEQDYYGGTTSIGLPIMTAASFNAFSEFLSQLHSSSLLSYKDLVMLYLASGNTPLEYAPESVSR
jgi:hypothetical protein